MILFDTDIIIWTQRGNEKAANLLEKTQSRIISTQTYMELFQCAVSKEQHRVIRNFLITFSFQVLPLTENIGHRAAVYIEEYSLSSGLRAGDAIVAATAVENGLILSSSNRKHFKDIRDLQLQIFKP
jgi:predicted nucleic acid-binding protein